MSVTCQFNASLYWIKVLIFSLKKKKKKKNWHKTCVYLNIMYLLNYISKTVKGNIVAWKSSSIGQMQ